ncbi:hypothetical protein SAMN05660464_4339 [Geodermatophilus dictyosporus]|uniref:SnoaL-like domain-containing protein n=1 Tax=Geodermatophilus dictyosporus TaxID=1523247 RepID=A0A1I5THN7_9ACTN|nr:hypothetical protein SAMN05660464_4339 [Geodermatophilus dictyosporus]
MASRPRTTSFRWRRTREGRGTSSPGAEHQVWSAHDPAAWVGSFRPDAQLVGPGVSGSAAEPDNEVHVVGVFEGGATGILQAEFHGTQTGPMNAPGQSIPATGRRVALPFVLVNRFDDGGRTTHSTLYLDRAELPEQLGVLPVPGRRGRAGQARRAVSSRYSHSRTVVPLPRSYRAASAARSRSSAATRSGSSPTLR